MDINNRFYEEFKRLDKLLSYAYGEMHGVTAYINDMKTKYGIGIIGWQEDLKKLKKLRDIRNKLSHEVGYGDIKRVSEDDILFIKNFYKRVLSGTDPLSQLNKKNRNTVKKQQKNSKTACCKKSSDNETNQPDWALITFIVTVIAIISVFIGVIINILL